jgi:hypothetical protein
MKYETKENLKKAGCMGLVLVGIGSCVAGVTACDNAVKNSDIEDRVAKSYDLEVEPLSIEYQQPGKYSTEGLSMLARDSNGREIICRDDAFLDYRASLRDFSAVVKAKAAEHGKIKIRGYNDHGTVFITYAESGDFKIGIKPKENKNE